MSLELVSENKELNYDAPGGAKIKYRRMPGDVRARIIKECTKRGQVDGGKAYMKMARYVVVGWENVTADGEVVEFDRSLVTRLPGEVLEDIMERADAALDFEDGDEKNSSTTSASSSPSTTD